MASTYLSRTPSSAGNRKIFTISTWVKLGKIQTSGAIFSARSGTPWGVLDFSSGDGVGFDHCLQFSLTAGSTPGVYSTRLFRDPSAWYHILVAVDTTQSTASNRVKMYINGIQETLISGNYPTLNQDSQFNSTIAHYIGSSATSNYFDGYMNNFAFVDGTALTPTSFGETDSTSGIWKFKTPSGITWGTNGVHLKFDNSANLGLDSSGQTNNYTLSGDGRQAKDTPQNVRVTLNTLLKDIPTMSNGNTTATHTATSHRSVPSTIGASSGKWYWEAKAVTVNATNNGTSIGIVRTDSDLFKTSAWNSGDAAGEAVYTGGGELQLEGTGTSNWGSTYDDGDIIGVAMDLTNMKLYFHKNGVYQNSGVPTSGSTGTGAVTIPALNSNFYLPMIGLYGTVWSTNFGNGYFGTTAITSAGSNGNGSLFEYDVPSGYYALNTKNLNTYG